MVGVVWPAENITALVHKIFAELFGARFLIVMRRAQRRPSAKLANPFFSTKVKLAFDRWRIEDIKRELDAIGCNVTRLKASLRLPDKSSDPNKARILTIRRVMREAAVLPRRQ
jgi:hypothetical protein